MNSIKIFDTKKHFDERGFFMESFPCSVLNKLEVQFKQDNLSFSKKGVVRGLHYQWDKPMGKLVSVIKGSIIDYVVDIRFNSETYGNVYMFELSERNNSILWIPAGFAHGFEALEDSYVAYKCSSEYNSSSEGSINILDKDIAISLQTPLNCVIMSERDSSAMSFSDYCDDPKFFKEET